MSDISQDGHVEAVVGLLMIAESHDIRVLKPPLQPFYGPFYGTTRVSRCQKRTSLFYGAF